MTDNTTMKRVNAVFFSVLMLLSMVSVGFAAAPAVANATSGSITFDSQGLDSNDEVTVDVSSLDDPDVTVVITNPDDEVAGVTEATGVEPTSASVSVAINTTVAAFGERHTAHLFNPMDAPPSITEGEDTSGYTSDAFATDTAFVGAEDGVRQVGEKLVYDDSNVYQGEDNFVLANESVDIFDLERTSGNREGTVLQLPIATDANTGTYAVNGPNAGSGEFKLTVVNPQINTAEVQLDGEGIKQVSPADADEIQLYVVAGWNFGEAENVEVTVEDESGADITDEVLNVKGSSAVESVGSNTVMTDSAESRVGLNLENQGAGEYTVIFEGSDDLDYGDVVEEHTIKLQNPSITTRDSVGQGAKLDYVISGTTADRYYFLTLSRSNFGLGITRENAANIFADSNDLVEAGKFTGTEYINGSESAGAENAEEVFSDDAKYAYALVKSDTEGISGSINTEYLDSSQIEITVYNSTTGDFSGDIGELFYDQSGVDITAQSEQISSTSAEILPEEEEEETIEDKGSIITPAQPSVDRSELLDYTTSGLSAGDYHLVTIEKEEFASSLSVSEASDIFTTGGQTVETGVANQSSTDITQASDIEYAYALIEVDGTSPTGQINTEYLSSPTVDVNLFPAGEGRTGNQLTSPLDTSTVGFPSPEPSYNLTLENDGSVHSVGFPGPIRGDLNDLFVSGADGINAIYRFNSTTKSWEQQTELGRSPEELTAIAIVTSGTGPSEIQMKMAFDQRTVAVPGTRSLNTEGWHFVSPSSFDTPGTVFNRGTSRNSLVLDSFEGPQLEIAQTPATFQAQHGSRVYDMRSDNPPVMNPFEGYFVYITRRGDQPALIANADTRYELDSTLNVTYD